MAFTLKECISNCAYRTIISFGLCFIVLSGFPLEYGALPSVVVLDSTDGDSDLYEEMYREFPVFNGSEDTSWRAFTLVNHHPHRKWMLEFLDFTIDELELYIQIDGETVSKFKTGDAYPFNTRAIRHKNFIFELPYFCDEPCQVFFRTKKHGHRAFSLHCKISSLPMVLQYTTREYAFLSIFYGVILCMGCFNLIRFFFTKDKIHIIYFLYTIAMCLFTLARIDGMGFQFVWPNLPAFNSVSFEFSLYAFIFLSLLFGHTFLELKSTTKWLVIYLTARGVLMIESLNGWLEIDLKLYDLISMGVLVVYGLIRLEASKRHSWLFLFAYCSMFIGFGIYTVQNYNWITHTFWTYYSLNFGSLLEVLFLSMAISEKSRLDINEKNRVQRKLIINHQKNEELQSQLIHELREKESLKDRVTAELEDRVQERTQELVEKNTKLNELTNELNRINSKLDISLWQKQKEVKEVSKTKILGHHYSYTEFTETFPQESDCYRLIEKMKWGEGYNCKSCGNEKWHSGGVPYSRKCSKCNRKETLTADTIFHRLRFPIRKALYIVYSVNDDYNLTLKELSESLELRQSTCSSFRNKVREKRKSLNKKSTTLTDLIT